MRLMVKIHAWHQRSIGVTPKMAVKRVKGQGPSLDKVAADCFETVTKVHYDENGFESGVDWAIEKLGPIAVVGVEAFYKL